MTWLFVVTDGFVFPPIPSSNCVDEKKDSLNEFFYISKLKMIEKQSLVRFSQIYKCGIDIDNTIHCSCVTAMSDELHVQANKQWLSTSDNLGLCFIFLEHFFRVHSTFRPATQKEHFNVQKISTFGPKFFHDYPLISAKNFSSISHTTYIWTEDFLRQYVSYRRASLTFQFFLNFRKKKQKIATKFLPKTWI